MPSPNSFEVPNSVKTIDDVVKSVPKKHQASLGDYFEKAHLNKTDPASAIAGARPDWRFPSTKQVCGYIVYIYTFHFCFIFLFNFYIDEALLV